MTHSLQQIYAASPLFAGNADYIEDLYASWLQDPGSVNARWRQFFAEQAPPVAGGAPAVSTVPVVRSPALQKPVCGRCCATIR